jgi:hypothetical protein
VASLAKPVELVGPAEPVLLVLLVLPGLPAPQVKPAAQVKLVLLVLLDATATKVYSVIRVALDELAQRVKPGPKGPLPQVLRAQRVALVPLVMLELLVQQVLMDHPAKPVLQSATPVLLVLWVPRVL